MTRNINQIVFHVHHIALTVLLVVQYITANAVTATSLSTTSTTHPTSRSRFDDPLVEHKYERSCKALCEHCGCLGFYCGEECICECNNESSDTECIHTMQANARTLNSPFEILIQGPSTNRFVRNAQQFEQKLELLPRSAAQSNNLRNRRSTITIYKPGKQALTANALEPLLSKNKMLKVARNKRSVDHLDWFNDFANTMVRPAPFGTLAQKQREAAPLKRQVTKTVPLSLPEPWFFEQPAPRLTRPAPLHKRQLFRHDTVLPQKTKINATNKFSSLFSPKDQSEPKQVTQKPSPDIRPFRDALQVVERIPRVLQDTVSHLAADNNNGDVFSLNIVNEVQPKENERKEQKRTQRRLSDRIRYNDVIPTTTRTTLAPVVVSPTLVAPSAPHGLLFPWLHQRRSARLRGGQ